MTDWTKITLGELGHTFTGLSGKKKEDFGDGAPFITYMNVFSNSTIDPAMMGSVRVRKDENQNKVFYGDIFFTTSSETVNEVGMTSVLLDELPDTYLNSFCFGFRLGDFETLLPQFAAYLFRGDEVRRSISLKGQGSTRFNLSKTELLADLILSIPTRAEQKRIAEILSTVDAAIEQTRALIDKYSRIKRGLMHDLLTRGIDESGNIRTKQTHKFTIKNGIEVPDEWDVVKLVDLRKSKDYLKTGPFGSSLKISDWTETGVPVITIGSIGDGSIDVGNLLYVSQRKAEALFAYRLANGDILFSRVADVGRSIVITEEQIGWIMSSNFMRLRVDAKRMLPSFLQMNLKENDAVKSQIRRNSNSGGRDLVNSEVLNSLYFPKPSIGEQERIAEKIKAFDRDEIVLSKLHAIKKGLMQDLLSGRKRVKMDA